jgi:hypothetical protein
VFIQQLTFMETLPRDERLAALSRQLRAGEGECPFVIRRQREETVKLAHFSAGRDATYVALEADKPANITIGYRAFVEGTTLIYDLTDETLQGKARPFECDLRTGGRAYALLPVQIEAISLALRGRRIEVEFHDARGERIEAALPFKVMLTSADSKVRAYYSSTDRDGRFVREISDAERGELLSVSVRSLLTGRDELMQLHR